MIAIVFLNRCVFRQDLNKETGRGVSDSLREVVLEFSDKTSIRKQVEVSDS